MKKGLIIFLMGILAINLAGCSSSKKTENNDGKESGYEQVDDDKNKDKANETNKDSDENAEKLKLEEEKKKEEEKKRLAEEKAKKEAEAKKMAEANKNKQTEKTFTLYSVDPMNEKTIVTGTVKSKSDSIKENLNLIANNISKKSFDSLKIEVKSVKDVKGKLIATINLNDGGSDEWYQRFQGSLGGYVTETTLIDSLLQRGYKGSWISGVEFMYNGKKLEELAHTPRLAVVNYR
ncbi:MAG: hypothetical protein ACRCVJ_15860 [Clostridium sp.]|uniref:hypothetical protein n=1 Tax=Clostridium sp. TaxID=1506 RepID=UPI003F368B3F